MRDAERVLVHGALGGLAAGFPGIARQLGASRVVGTVRASDLDAAQRTRLPYDEIIDSAELPARLAGERFEIIIDPVGGSVRTASIELLAPGRRSPPRSQSWPAGAVRSSSDWTDCLVRSCCHLTPGRLEPWLPATPAHSRSPITVMLHGAKRAMRPGDWQPGHCWPQGEQER